MPKINKDSALNITLVGIGLCLLCSAIISFIAIQLRSVQENNVVLDMQKKIVSSAGLEKVYGSVENAMSNIKTLIIDLDKGEIVDINPDSYELAKELREDGKYKFLSAEEDVASIKKREKNSKVYIEYKDNEINTLILPVRGYGLWGILYGYLLLKEILILLLDWNSTSIKKLLDLVLRLIILSGKLYGKEKNISRKW